MNVHYTEGLSFSVDNATVSVWHDGPEYYRRQRYAYRIETEGWEYIGNNIESDIDADIDVADAARTLFTFLGACAEARAYHRHSPYNEGGENADLFPEHVGQWAETHSDEIAMLSMDLEEMEL